MHHLSPDREARLRRGLRERRLDALVCALPSNVVMLTGYWPVVGTALVVATDDGELTIVAPDDEQEIANWRWSGAVETFRPHSLHDLRSVSETVSGALARFATRRGLARARIGWEAGVASEPASYAAMNLYSAALPSILHAAVPDAVLVAADDLLADLRSVKSPEELERIRVACRFAAAAFSRGAEGIAVGCSETEIAALFRTRLSVGATGHQKTDRADGFIYCMSGTNAAHAAGGYARSRAKRIFPADLVLVHCNSYADGYWTDITRTYCVAPHEKRERAMYAAVLEARRAALAAIRPGVRAADVDRAARDVIAAHGFAQCFPHGTGHGVGFAAIDPLSRPRLHPQSPDILEVGMVFNLKPAIYLEGLGAVRHCDMVAVAPDGPDLLTPFHATTNDLLLTKGSL